MPTAVVLTLWLAAVLAGIRHFRKDCITELNWANGQWTMDGKPVCLTICQDWASIVLIRMEPSGAPPTQYAWLGRSGHCGEWMDVRRALYSTPNSHN
jgi:hypothetical protein